MTLSRNNSHQMDEPSPLPYTIQNLHAGQHYIRDGTTIIPCQSTTDPLSLPPSQEVIKVLSKQMGRLLLQLDIAWVTKEGSGVLPTEAEAMRLVFNNTDVPGPEVLFASFHRVNEIADPQQCDIRDSNPPDGLIGMTIAPGIPMTDEWDTLDDDAKESICYQLWDLVAKFRTIAHPQNDTNVRTRIYERYLHFGGLRYKNQLPRMLPRSEHSVFTHADIAPRNVMVDEENRVTGLLDWEWAGWYPDYWEYAQIMRPAFKGDWSEWMERTAPQRWDLRGIGAARKVLF
ncbi:kinase-like protein [Aspergillus campestris IBT 28561]|uniref:Kinase-like protein n=1 Tax=Aspergillus campestris (strain IBT 28561) TaxID=1392248 RepID=A0A2I1D7E4_ASPC2|nr:kinase-like protein [Aspergillus campestris IBT 28561]PKY05773.1 kinase-like protein [Aspergillus campestris IBT 28561]